MVISTLPTSWHPVGANPMPCWRQATPMWQWQNMAYLCSVDYTVLQSHPVAGYRQLVMEHLKNFTEVLLTSARICYWGLRENGGTIQQVRGVLSHGLPFPHLCVARKADRVAGCHICPRGRRTQCCLYLFTHPQPSWAQLAPCTHWMGNICELQSLSLPELSTAGLNVLEELCF